MFNAISSVTKRFAGVHGIKFAPVEVDLYGRDKKTGPGDDPESG